MEYISIATNNAFGPFSTPPPRASSFSPTMIRLFVSLYPSPSIHKRYIK